MERESKVLLVAGFLLLFATIGWSFERHDPGGIPASAPFRSRGERIGGELPLVGIVFSPQDCGSQIEQLRLWNEPYLAHEAHVTGLLRTDGDDLEPLWKVVHGAGLQFPIRPASSDALVALQRSLGYPAESYLAVFDPGGRLRLAVPLDQLSEPRDRVAVLRFVRALRRPSADGGRR